MKNTGKKKKLSLSARKRVFFSPFTQEVLGSPWSKRVPLRLLKFRHSRPEHFLAEQVRITSAQDLENLVVAAEIPYYHTAVLN